MQMSTTATFPTITKNNLLALYKTGKHTKMEINEALTSAVSSKQPSLKTTPYVPTPPVVKKQATKKGKENVAAAAGEVEEKNYKEYEVSKPTLTCRIEYDLYPNNLKYFDVFCWGDAATVVTGEHSASLQVHVRDELSWIHFRIKHEIDIDIPTFCEHEMKFSVVANRKQAQAKGRILYGSKDHADLLFEPLFENLEATDGGGGISVVAETGAHFKFVQEAILKATTADTLKNGGNEFSISGQTFLAGIPEVKTGIRNQSQELPIILTMASAETLITKQQMRQYNFISIIINKLNGLPCQDLHLAGISQIKLRYVICGERVETGIFNINDRIIINHAKTVLIANLDFWTLVEFLQTKGLRVEIMGMLPDGEEALGVAVVDIYPLLYSPYRLRSKCGFKPVDVVEEVKNEKFRPCYNVNEINSGMKDRRLVQLTTSSATVKVTARLFKGIKIPPKPANSINRIFIVLRDLTSSVHFFNLIFENFPDMVDHLLSGTKIQRPATHHHPNQPSPPDDYADTGFLIDCIDKILIFIESTSFERIWESALMIDSAKGQILYDSSLIFLNRLYKDFRIYGGFYTITLREPLEVLMSKQKTYIKGSLPFPAWKALISLHQLIHCSSMKTACRDNLFPSPKSLYSLNIEFGVPLTSQNKLDD